VSAPAAFNISISPRVDSDVPECFAYAKTAFEGRPGWSDRRVIDALERDVVFVAHEDGLPAGYVALSLGDDALVIEQLLVAPGHEQHGVGRRLLAHAEGYAITQHARALQIVVEEDNVVARRFYLRCGFVPVAPELVELILPGSA
jgi:ribosomal protein S18 acetylase RimI-like enzyme